MKKTYEEKNRSVDFCTYIPNKTTQNAINDSRAGKVKSFSSVEELFKDLEDDED